LTGIFATKEQLKKIEELSQDPLKEMCVQAFLEYYNFKWVMDLTESLADDLVAIMEGRMTLPTKEKKQRKRKDE